MAEMTSRFLGPLRDAGQTPHEPNPDVCVIGAGIMGLSAAWQLARRGRRVVCIDRGAPGREATAATAGTLAVQNKMLGVVPMVLRSVALWRELAAELGGGIEYDRRGGLRVADTDEEVRRLELVTAAYCEIGAPLEMVYAPQLGRLAPYLSPRTQAASYCADDGMASPFGTVRTLVTACRAAGVRFVLDAEATGLEERADGSVLVRTGTGTIGCGRALMAAGAWIPRLAATIGVELPIVTRIQHVLITDAGPPLFPHVVTHIKENLTLKQQRVSGKVLVGGGWTGEGDRDTGIRRLVRAHVRANVQAAIEVIPSLSGTRLLRGWTGFEGRTPDRLPVMGPLREGSSIHVLGCASGGFTLAPVIGLMAAQALCGETPVHPMEPFSVARFAVPARPESSEVPPRAAAGPSVQHVHGS